MFAEGRLLCSYLFCNDIDDLLRNIDFLDDISGKLVTQSLLCRLAMASSLEMSAGIEITTLGLAVDLNGNLDLIILHGILIVLRPGCS